MYISLIFLHCHFLCVLKQFYAYVVYIPVAERVIFIALENGWLFGRIVTLLYLLFTWVLIDLRYFSSDFVSRVFSSPCFFSVARVEIYTTISWEEKKICKCSVFVSVLHCSFASLLGWLFQWQWLWYHNRERYGLMESIMNMVRRCLISLGIFVLSDKALVFRFGSRSLQIMHRPLQVAKGPLKCLYLPERTSEKSTSSRKSGGSWWPEYSGGDLAWPM